MSCGEIVEANFLNRCQTCRSAYVWGWNVETADFFSQERFMSGMQLSEWKLCVGRAIISAELLGGRGWLVFVGIGRQGLWGHSC